MFGAWVEEMDTCVTPDLSVTDTDLPSFARFEANG